jgi:hypothetical protein
MRCSGGLNFFSIFEEMVRRCDHLELEFFATTARRLWMRKNPMVHGENFIHPNQIIKEVGIAIDDFQQVNLPEKKDVQKTQHDGPVMWQPLPVNIVKINWDAAVDHRNRRIGLGCIAQNSEGVFLARRSITKECVVDPSIAEALATVYAVLFGNERGFRQIIFEGDTLQTVQAINENNT